MTRPTTIKVTGLRMIISAMMGYAKESENLVAFFLAVILGMVSPKMMTATVIAAVDTQVYFSPSASMTATDPMEDAAMLTRLLPTRMVDSASSNLLAIQTASPAFLFPLSRSCSKRTLLQAE